MKKRQRSRLRLRRRIASSSSRVSGHSCRHARQHHVMRIESPVTVVSSVTVPDAPHSLQLSGTRTRSGLVATPLPVHPAFRNAGC